MAGRQAARTKLKDTRTTDVLFAGWRGEACLLDNAGVAQSLDGDALREDREVEGRLRGSDEAPSVKLSRMCVQGPRRAPQMASGIWRCLSRRQDSEARRRAGILALFENCELHHACVIRDIYACVISYRKICIKICIDRAFVARMKALLDQPFLCTGAIDANARCESMVRRHAAERENRPSHVHGLALESARAKSHVEARAQAPQ
eukprot:6192490-Pleurochrysis_carterae.AAC.1